MNDLIAVWTVHAWDPQKHLIQKLDRCFTVRQAEYPRLSGDEMAELFERRRDEAVEYARNLMDPKRITRVTLEFVWV